MDSIIIKRILAREILDSRGNPTLEVDILTDCGSGKIGFGRGVAPSGASTGKLEAIEIRDGGKRYYGKGVKKAIEKVNRISKKLIGMNVMEQNEIDKILIEEGGEQKKEIGGNTTTAISMAACAAAANSIEKEIFEYLNPNARILPVPMMNVINGGKHAGSGLAIQEFMIIPKKFNTFSEALQAGSEIYHSLGSILTKKYGQSARNVGDEGGYAPMIRNTEEALDSIVKAIEENGYQKKVFLGIDAAASSFHELKHYRIDGRTINGIELMRFYQELIKRYPIISIEDPFEETEWELLSRFTRESGKDVQIVGDDYFVSNIKMLRKGINNKAANALLLKVNQIGTVTEAMNAARIAMNSDYNVIVSHRSGETEDTFIADLAVALECGQIKTGAPCRGERTAKYNRLLRIEEKLGKKARFGK
jgi:enolase